MIGANIDMSLLSNEIIDLNFRHYCPYHVLRHWLLDPDMENRTGAEWEPHPLWITLSACADAE